MRIITFSGIDGSGKSTQLAFLRAEFETAGKRVQYFHAVAWSLPQAAKSLFARRTEKPGQAKAVTKSSTLGIVLRQIVLVIDLLRFRRYLKNLEHSGIDILLSDRYFYDSLVNIAYLDGTSLDTRYAYLVTRLIPKPDRAFFLSVSAEAVMRRERAPEQGRSYLKDKQGLFVEAATLWDFITIDADETLESVRATVQTKL